MSKDSAKVAIITRTKDRVLLLNRAINSVLSQSYDNWIHVIINDGGESEPVDRLVENYQQQYTGRLKVIHNHESMGMEAASNKAIKSVNSQFVVIHDDDDSWEPEFLEITTRSLDNPRYPTVMGVITRTNRVVEEIVSTNDSQESVVIHSREEFLPGIKTIRLEELAAGNLFPPIAFIYRREVYDSVGYYDESLPVLGDWDFNLRFMLHYDIEIIPEILANYHHRLTTTPGSYQNSVFGFARMEFIETILKNRYLRTDISSGKFGLGFLLNTVPKITATKNLVHESHRGVMFMEKVSRLFFDNIILRTVKKIYRWIKSKV